MGKKLDEKKPYGTVFGEHGAAFEQDGVIFDAAGNEIATDPVKEPSSANVAAQTETKTEAKEKAKPGRKAVAETTKAENPALPATSAIDDQIGAQGA